MPDRLSLSLVSEVFGKELLPKSWELDADGRPWGDCGRCGRKLGPKSWVKTEEARQGTAVCGRCWDRELAEKQAEKAAKELEAWKDSGFSRGEPHTKAQCLELALAGLNLLKLSLESLLKLEKKGRQF